MDAPPPFTSASVVENNSSTSIHSIPYVYNTQDTQSWELGASTYRGSSSYSSVHPSSYAYPSTYPGSVHSANPYTHNRPYWDNIHHFYHPYPMLNMNAQQKELVKPPYRYVVF